MIFLREISSPDQGSADARRFDNETSVAQLGAGRQIGWEVWRFVTALWERGKELPRDAPAIHSIFDCVEAFIIISCYIFPLCYDHEMIIQ